MMRAVSLFALLTFLLFATVTQWVFAMSGAPYSPECVSHQIGTAPYDNTICNLVGEPYIAPNAVISEMPVSIIVPRSGSKLKLIVNLHGYTPTPVTCINDNFSQPDAVVIKICEWYYPDQRAYGQPYPMSWFGPARGANPTGWVIGEAVDTALERYGSRIDLSAGITLEGRSQGGTGAILQSILMAPYWREFVSVVNAEVPHTLFVAPGGQYWRDPAVRLAWGDFDYRLADFERAAAAGEVDAIYYRVRGGTNDSLGIVNTDFFRLCDLHKIACFGTWDLGGHSTTGEPGVNLPRSTYNAGQTPITRGGILPIFTGSTANYWGERGHYNLGLSAQTGMVQGGAIALPVRYLRVTGIGGGIPDQPEQVTFDLTLRHVNAQPGQAFTYRIGAQSGTAVCVKAGEITFEAITLQSSDGYTIMEVMK